MEAFYILALIIIFLIHKLSIKNFDYWKKRNVPFETPFPFLGNLPSFMSKHTSIGEWLAEICHKKKQPYFGLFISNKPILVIQDPQLAKDVLARDFDHFQNRSLTTPDDPILSQMIFFSSNPQWKSVRSKLTSVFSTGKLKLMFNLINNQAPDMINYIERNCRSDIEVEKVCGKFGLDAIAKCFFAIDSKCFENEDAEFMSIGSRLTSNGLRQTASWFAPAIVKLLNFGFYDPDCMERLTQIFTELIQFRKDSSLKGDDMVAILLNARENAEDKSQFSDDVILSQACLFFAGGFGNISWTMTFALYELSKQPEIQQKLRQEIKSNIETNGGITHEGMKEMKYLDMVVSEILRLYPIVPFLGRICTEDHELSGTDLVVEKGTEVWIPLWAFHRNPEYFPEPEIFYPERFSDKMVNKERFMYFPFGYGPRTCIAYLFSTMLVKLGLIIILSRFQVQPTEKTPTSMKLPRLSIVIKNSETVPLRFISD